MFTLKFIGVGSAFSGPDLYQSNAIIIAESGKKLLIDCGSHAQLALQEIGINNNNASSEIDGVYISHLHADHIGSLEWLAFINYFSPRPDKPKMFGVRQVLRDLWNKSLRGGLESLDEKRASLEDYFECHPISINDSFVWENISFSPVQTLHIVNGMKIEHSYGLFINEIGSSTKVFYTSDTQFVPTQLRHFYNNATLIFHDCETSPFRSGVHSHYDELKTLPDALKSKMWLYHYQPNSPQNPIQDGFCGFVKKGQSFTF